MEEPKPPTFKETPYEPEPLIRVTHEPEAERLLVRGTQNNRRNRRANAAAYRREQDRKIRVARAVETAKASSVAPPVLTPTPTPTPETP